METLKRIRPATAISILALVLAMGGTAGALRSAEPTERAPLTYTSLVLVNGWVPYGLLGTRTPSAAKDSDGVVHLRGAIKQIASTNATMTTLPPKFRPSGNLYVPVDMCDATNGRLVIESGGQVIVQAENLYSNAQCFTSLEGVSYAKN